MKKWQREEDVEWERNKQMIANFLEITQIEWIKIIMNRLICDVQAKLFPQFIDS